MRMLRFLAESSGVVLELFGCCCRRLSQHCAGEVLIPLRHCCGMLFSMFALAVDRFVTIGRRTEFCVVS